MKTTILITLAFLLSFNILSAQDAAIRIFKDEKEIIIKENKRVRVKPFKGPKVSGKLYILDSETIFVNNVKLKLSEIEKIKRHPLALSLVGSGILCSAGAFSVAFGIFYIQTGNLLVTSLLSGLGVGYLYAGVKSPNILKGYKKADNWNYEIIKLSE